MKAEPQMMLARIDQLLDGWRLVDLISACHRRGDRDDNAGHFMLISREADWRSLLGRLAGAIVAGLAGPIIALPSSPHRADVGEIEVMRPGMPSIGISEPCWMHIVGHLERSVKVVFGLAIRKSFWLECDQRSTCC